MKNFDFLVIGSGLAGLSFALKASALGRVAVISKSELMQTNSWRAQGGLAAVISHTDSFEKHITDTLTAGDGLCDPESVKRIVESAPQRIAELNSLGVKFDSVDGDFELAQEGGHSHRRILHVDDKTGQALHSHFIKLAQEDPNITLFENLFVSELLLEDGICVGAKAFNHQHEYSFFSEHIVLATGGTGKCFLYTSNWSGATGDGIIMAYNAGARLSNLEFTQFHPTCLYHPMARNFLISEALRGEGGRLLNSKGEYFMEKYSPLKDLAPRDIVARAIDHEMKSTGSDCVWLDLAYMKNPELQHRFPQIYKRCLELGINFIEQPIPVVPAAHYMCGGISVDEHCQTSIPHLYAIGECADTGLHGANRLASNSLLECLVTAHFAFEKVQSLISRHEPQKQEAHSYSSVATSPLPHPIHSHDSQLHITSLWDETRQVMWLNMGIIRSQKLIKRAQKKIQHILEEIIEMTSDTPNIIYDPHFLELKNIVQISKLMIEAAKLRHESRGCHFDQDFPKKKAKIQKSSLHKDQTIEYIEI